ncbi:casparian strip membrane protein 1-like [Olea europaea var. sylvestris]|uniref:casparian strip membrane protein 1-like n=1 Tax=Olea europaea var. sylvestris TaxID=158386 RepID=UPI000C1D7B1B|nr:casparian strip membrane protein 1-like [Olea europaea var. sylvestris]
MGRNELTSIDVAETRKERKGKAPLLGAHTEHASGGYKRGIATYGPTWGHMGNAWEPLNKLFPSLLSSFGSKKDMMISQLSRNFPSSSFNYIDYVFINMPFVIVTLTTSAVGSFVSIVYLVHNGNLDVNWLAICQ